MLFNLLWYNVFEVACSPSVILLAVREGAEAVEAYALHELEQLGELLLALAGEAGHEGSAQSDARHLVAQPGDEVVGLCGVDVAAHIGQHGRGDVLQGYVEVAADVLSLAHHLRQFPGKVGGIGVVETDPLHAGHVRHPLHQLGQHQSAVAVLSVGGEILCDDVKLFHALCHQVACLVDDFLHRPGAVAPGDEGNGAVGAHSVAPFGYFQEGAVGWRGDVALPGAGRRGGTKRRQLVHKPLPVELAVPAVDFGDFRLELLTVALAETSHDHQLADVAVGLGLGQLQNHVDALLLCISYEAAGIDDHEWAAHVGAVVFGPVTLGLETAHQALRVHEVLGAAHGYDVYSGRIHLVGKLAVMEK